MSRTKKVQSITAVNSAVETNEVETDVISEATEKTAAEESVKKIDENKNYVVVNPILAGRKTMVDNVCYEFNDAGECEMSGKMAQFFSKIDGFSIR